MGVSKLKAILVSGGWSSGTSAVAGALHRLRLIGLGPFWHTIDERTPNAYELAPFRDLILSLASESELKIREVSKESIADAITRFRQRILNQEFGPYDPNGPPLFLKFPLSALLISELSSFFDIRMIVVTRPFELIEASRQRRQWPLHYGEIGAGVVYTHIFAALITDGVPAHFVHYPKLLREPEAHIRSMAHFCGVAPDETDVSEAVRFIEESAAAQMLKSQV